jgi:hypothetical protein
LISDKSLLVSAAEILTVEARHNSGLNTFNGEYKHEHEHEHEHK